MIWGAPPQSQAHTHTQVTSQRENVRGGDRQLHLSTALTAQRGAEDDQALRDVGHDEDVGGGDVTEAAHAQRGRQAGCRHHGEGERQQQILEAGGRGLAHGGA